MQSNASLKEYCQTAFQRWNKIEQDCFAGNWGAARGFGEVQVFIQLLMGALKSTTDINDIVVALADNCTHTIQMFELPATELAERRQALISLIISLGRTIQTIEHRSKMIMGGFSSLQDVDQIVFCACHRILLGFSRRHKIDLPPATTIGTVTIPPNWQDFADAIATKLR